MHFYKPVISNFNGCTTNHQYHPQTSMETLLHTHSKNTHDKLIFVKKTSCLPLHNVFAKMSSQKHNGHTRLLEPINNG